MTTKISLVSILHHSYFKAKIILLVMRTSKIYSLQFSSVTQSCLTHFNPVDCSMSGFPVHYQLPEPTQTHVLHVGEAIQPSPVYLKFYNVTDEVKLYTKSLLAIFACYLWVKVSNMVMLGGVLRSGGKTRYTLILDLIGTWGIGIPLGFLCAFVFKWNILMVYTAINIEEVIRLTLGLIKVKSKDWISIID